MKKFILSFIMMLSLALLWNGGGKEVKAASNSYVCTSIVLTYHTLNYLNMEIFLLRDMITELH